MSSRRVIGLAPFLDIACNAWRRARPDLAIESQAVGQGSDFVFDASTFPAPDVPTFVAIDNRFLSFKRLELMHLLSARGHSFERIVALHAVVGTGATLGDNVMIGEGAVIGDGASIGNGACIGPRSVIGPRAVIGPGAWLEAGVVVGARAHIGAQTTVTSGVVIADGIEIGELSLLAIPGLVRVGVADRTYHHPAFPEPIRILG